MSGQVSEWLKMLGLGAMGVEPPSVKPPTPPPVPVGPMQNYPLDPLDDPDAPKITRAPRSWGEDYLGDAIDLFFSAIGLPTGTEESVAKGAGELLGAAAPLGAVGALKKTPAAAAATRTGTLQKRWPSTAQALTKRGAPLELPGARRSPATALDRLAADIHARTLADSGSSTNPFTGAILKKGDPGFVAGRYSNQSGKTKAIPLAQFTPGDVRAFMEEHADEFMRAPKEGTAPVVGTWVQDVGGVPHVYLDVAQQHDTARGATVSAARQKQPPTTARDPVTGAWPKAQEAIYDLERGADLPVGNFAEFVASPEFQRRLDDMYEAGVPVMKGTTWWNLFGGPLERVYGRERMQQVAGALASTSPASAPVHNLRSGSEYLRRLIKGEPIVQPDFRIPDTAVGSREGFMGATAPGDFNGPGTQMPMEATRAPNLRKVEAWGPGGPDPTDELTQLQKDKINDMFHALTGHDVSVIDRRYAKLAEAPERGIYVDATKDKVPGTMGTTKVSPYALIQNAVIDAARRRNMPVADYSATVWEGIGDTIKRTGQLYGVKHPAHTIPDASLGFGGIFDAMVKEKAAAWGISVKEFERRLRRGDAELLGVILATPVGMAAFQQWQREAPTTETASPQLLRRR